MDNLREKLRKSRKSYNEIWSEENLVQFEAARSLYN
jgi:hypothetical protein